MPENSHAGHHSIRLPGYDYSQPGGYFITIVTQGKIARFSEVIDGEARLNDAGRMIQARWLGIPERFPNIELSQFVIMPNHFHATLFIVESGKNSVGAALVAAQSTADPDEPSVQAPLMAPQSTADLATPSVRAALVAARTKTTLGDVIGAFKSITTHEYILGVKNHGWPPFDRRLWQRDYYERIIRSHKDLDLTAEYIRYNPFQWDQDRENPIFDLV